MAPRANRPPAPYRQIVQHYRQQITDGHLAEGTRLPTVVAIAQEWGVANATAAKAVSALSAEGLVSTTPQGTFVSGEAVAHSPRDRIRSWRRNGRLYKPGEVATIVTAELVAAPQAVADALGVNAGELVIRRERVVRRNDKRPVESSISWLPGAFAEAVPELLTTDRIPGGTVGRIQQLTGRAVMYGRDQLLGRAATEAEAARLNLAPSAPILVGTNVWSDDEGVIEFGQFILPTSHVTGYEYTWSTAYDAEPVSEDEDPSP